MELLEIVGRSQHAGSSVASSTEQEPSVRLWEADLESVFVYDLQLTRFAVLQHPVAVWMIKPRVCLDRPPECCIFGCDRMTV